MSFTDLQIEDARILGKRLSADGVIILTFDRSGEYVKGASWGRNRERCGYYGGLMDTLIDEHIAEAMENQRR